jgi:MFS family permease
MPAERVCGMISSFPFFWLTTARQGLASDVINYNSSYSLDSAGSLTVRFPCQISSSTITLTSCLDLWLQGVAVVLPQIQQELLPSRVEFATLSLYVGLILGATIWGSLADLIGRRLSFNVSVLAKSHTSIYRL